MKPYSIGVDLGGTNLRIAAYEGGREFLQTLLLPTRLEAGPDAVVKDMCDGILELQRQFAGRPLTGVGVGAPGPLELPGGVVRQPPNLTGWDGFGLRAAIESRLERPIALESDGNLAALAEQRLGAGASLGIDTMCLLTLGTGVGSGIILRGEVWDGFTGMGGEAGHVIVETTDGALCGCGGRGCLEQYASATAILRLARELMAAPPDSAHEVALRAQSGDAGALQVFARMGTALAIALAGLINTLNLPLFLLGGGACQAWELFSPTLLAELPERSYVYRLTQPEDNDATSLQPGKTYVRVAELGSSAGLLGACLLATTDAKAAAH